MSTRRARSHDPSILARSTAPFVSRAEAGRLLGFQLLKYKAMEPVVLGIPRGGVQVAAEVARVLDARLDLVCARKLVSPDDPDCVVGAVCEDGSSFLDDLAVHQAGTDADCLQKERLRQGAAMAEAVRRYRAAHQKVSLKSRMAILVDDAAATGETMRAAIWTVMKAAPRGVIVALPVAPRYVLDSLAQEVNNVVCLRTPVFFEGIEDCYLNFPKVDDRGVLDALRVQPERGTMMW